MFARLQRIDEPEVLACDDLMTATFSTVTIVVRYQAVIRQQAWEDVVRLGYSPLLAVHMRVRVRR